MAQINIRIDDELKENLEKVCDDLGMNITTAFTVFAKKVTREKRIPFDVSVDSFYSDKNLNHLAQSLSQIREGKTIVKTLQELEALENE